MQQILRGLDAQRSEIIREILPGMLLEIAAEVVFRHIDAGRGIGQRDVREVGAAVILREHDAVVAGIRKCAQVLGHIEHQTVKEQKQVVEGLTAAQIAQFDTLKLFGQTR